MAITAEIITDSISPAQIRLTTFKLRYPKFIHGEFMTHRRISRNASSSRAVPTAKLIEEVRNPELRAEPVFWGKNQKGMQAAEELGAEAKLQVQWCWAQAAHEAANMAEQMESVGTHKQIVNRLLEPFSHINVVATANEWENFFGLRLHRDAQPEMRRLAEEMWAARATSTPHQLQPGEWHLPFVDRDDLPYILEVKQKMSVARCARVSYESFETKKRSTIEEDLKLYDRLLSSQPLHASPAEHQATPDSTDWGRDGRNQEWKFHEQWGNFHGWRQYRKMLPGESCAPLPEGYS